MKSIWMTLLAMMLLAGGQNALAQAQTYPMSAWLTREVHTFSGPEDGAEDGGVIAKTGHVTWIGTQGKWAHVMAQGTECYVPVDALTTDRVFSLDSQPTRNMQWPYEGEIRISPDGTMRVVIGIAEAYAGESIFGEADLLRFEVLDAGSGQIVCTAELCPDSDPVVYEGEGIYAEGTSLIVKPVFTHSGYAVEIQW